ncbi:hypothetical protein EJB05_52437, partial [Eragrostis curvula]
MTTRLTTFAVRRRDPELVGLARPTPRETKRLSDIDDQIGLRWHMPLVFFYRGGGVGHEEKDPVRVVRRALGEALCDTPYVHVGQMIDLFKSFPMCEPLRVKQHKDGLKLFPTHISLAGACSSRIDRHRRHGRRLGFLDLATDSGDHGEPELDYLHLELLNLVTHSL